MPTATRPRTPSASTVHRARSPHLRPRERPPDREDRPPPEPRDPPERTDGERVARACLAWARVAGVRELMRLPGRWDGAVGGRAQRARTHEPTGKYGALPWRNLNRAPADHRPAP